MKPEIDGRGGGFGKYQGLSLAEIQALFDGCVADPSMRSISAVLRITREQLESRGQLGVYPVLAWVAGVAGLVFAAVRLVGPTSVGEFATKGALGAGAAFVLLLISIFPTRHARKSNLSQEKAIREMAVVALNQILEHRPALKALTVEQDMTVRILLKKAKGSEALAVLLG